MIVGTTIIREPNGIVAECTPMRPQGWRVETRLGITEHPTAGDPWIALDRHMAEVAA